jgi:glutathione S-transferase
MENSYKVYYFPGNGRGATMRAILSYAKASWENVKVVKDEFAKMKTEGKLEFGQLPALEVNNDGRLRSQTIAIELYLARVFNLLGKTPEDEYEIISLLASRDDITSKVRPILMPFTEEETKNKEENTKNWLSTGFPFFLKAFEKRFTARGGPYLLGDTFSLGDIFYANTLLTCRGPGKDGWEEVYKQYAPIAYAAADRVLQNELVDYVKNVHNHEAPL